MNFDAIRAELDQEMAWRVEEIKFFQKLGESAQRGAKESVPEGTDIDFV